MKINTKEMTMVKPDVKTPSGSLWLFNLDLIPSNCHVPYLYFYRHNGEANFFDTAVLKAALSRALVAFYPVAGRFRRDNTGRIEIDCNGEGVLFAEAKAEGETKAVLDASGNLIPTAELSDILIPAVDCTKEISTYPLFVVQKYSNSNLGSTKSNQTDDQETSMLLICDGQSRIKPQIPLEFFGNVVFATVAIGTSGELQSHSLGQTAGKVHDAIARVDSDYLSSVLDYLEVQPDLKRVAQNPHRLNCSNLGLTSWTRLPYYNANFGWGCLIFVGPGKAPPEGKGYLIPSPTSDGSFLLLISLSEPHMTIFEKLLYDI